MNWSPANRRDGLRSVNDLLGPTLARLGVDDLSTMLGIIENWPDLAGAVWAEHTTPVVLRRKTLVVEVSNPTAIRLVRFGEHELIRSIQARFGPESVTSVDVVAPSR